MKIRELTARVISQTCHALAHYRGAYLYSNELISEITNLNDSEFRQFMNEINYCGLKMLVHNNKVAVERLN